jgi:phosphate starvation-inducible PhoH-like protein
VAKVKDDDESPIHWRKFELLNDEQKAAWEVLENNDVVFLIGCAGTGKSFLSVAYAINELLTKKKKKIVLTRPIVEAAGEALGFLPGSALEKCDPYMTPLWDVMDVLVGKDGAQRAKVKNATEVAPLAFLRGRTMTDAVCIFDEAQNATKMQIKLFLTRLGNDSKMIINADPEQADIKNPCIMEIARKLKDIEGVGFVEFTEKSIVRHPLVREILERLK